MSKLKEIHLRDSVEAFFAEHGYRTFAEVRMINRWVDLVAVGNGRIVAVELKLENWREALRQAVAYQVGADFSAVGMPLGKAIDAYRNRYYFQREGVGLLGVRVRTPEVRMLVEPERSTRMMPFVRDNLFDVMIADGEEVVVPRSSKYVREKDLELRFEEAWRYSDERDEEEGDSEDVREGSSM